MKKIDFGQAVAILANLGVIAGIVFLGIELRQNNQLMSEEAQRARAASIQQGYTQLTDNGELAAIWVKDRNGEDLDPIERLRLSTYHMRGLTGFQTSFQQLPREELMQQADAYRRAYERSSTFRATWEGAKGVFQPDFIQFIEENVVSH